MPDYTVRIAIDVHGETPDEAAKYVTDVLNETLFPLDWRMVLITNEMGEDV